MIVSIEVPVFKGQFLQQCIDSILNQTSDAWQLSLVWDGGDDLSREILERTKKTNNSKINIYFTPNQGIARARAFLSSQNTEAYILPLDDDDELDHKAVEVFIEAAKASPWASLIRAKRGFIDEKGKVVEEAQWFPFGPRNYYRGMVTDVFNQAQPYLMRRTAYERTLGWQGFDDFMHAGEDCNIFLQLEEVAHFELIDKVLYHYRLHNQRASDTLTSAAAFEMWRRLADESLQRMSLPLVRISDTPPFKYQVERPADKTLKDVEFVVRYNSPLIETLKEFGIEEKAIIAVPSDTDNLNWKMLGFRATTKELVCFLDNTVKISDSKALEKLVDTLNETEADVLAPSVGDGVARKSSWLYCDCLLVRREVLLATGGFDENFIPEALQGIDLYLQACRRNFRCYEASILGIEYDGSVDNNWNDDDLAQLRNKWHSHEVLLASIKELSNISGDGAP